MRFFTYYNTRNEFRLGVQLESVAVEAPLSPHELYANGLDALSKLESVDETATMLNLAELRYAPVVPNPGKIICVGMNYARHAQETGGAIPEYPILFSKFNNALAAAGETVAVSADWQRLDYEAELAVVIGRTARNVSEDDALDYVLGYANANDFSERSLQFRTNQWLLGKTPDKFLPLGPYLVTADEVGDPQNLTIRGWMNGELRQDSHTSDMVFSVAQIIAYASQYMTLEAGDVIVTGTPEGVILGYPEDERVWMQPGDEYTVEIEGLGRLTNQLVRG